MTILIAIGVVSCFLAFFFLFRAIHSVRHRRIVRAGGSCFSCALSAVVAAGSITFAFSYLSYSRLTEEQVVSQIEFRQIADEQFDARLMIEGRIDQHFTLNGNEWQLDARIITWKPPATILGLEPVFQMNRLSGRYTDVDKERSLARSVHALGPENSVDVWQFARRFPALLPGVDAYYGTATFVPMADRARFDVFVSRDALLARPANAAAEIALGNWQ